MKKTLLLALILCSCASAPAHVAAPVAPTNYALNYARASFPTADMIPVGEHTAFGRDGLKVILCIEVDAAHHSQCVAMADYTPQKQPEVAPAATPTNVPPVAPINAQYTNETKGKAEAPKKK